MPETLASLSAATPPSQTPNPNPALSALNRAAPKYLSAHQAAIAVGVLNAVIMTRKSRARKLDTHVQVVGTTTPTVVKARKLAKNAAIGTIVDIVTAGLTTLNADPAGTSKTLDLSADANSVLEVGDVLLLAVTGAPTSGTGLTASIEFDDI